MMRCTPSGASDRSFTSCLFVVAMCPLCVSCATAACACAARGQASKRLGDEEPLVLSLLPLDPGATVVGGCEPVVDGGAQLGLAAEPGGEGHLVEVDAEPRAELLQRAQLVQLGQGVDAVPRRRAVRHDEAEVLEIAEHARRPAGLGGGRSDGQRVHAATLSEVCEGSFAARANRAMAAATAHDRRRRGGRYAASRPVAYISASPVRKPPTAQPDVRPPGARRLTKRPTSTTTCSAAPAA